MRLPTADPWPWSLALVLIELQLCIIAIGTACERWCASGYAHGAHVRPELTAGHAMHPLHACCVHMYERSSHHVPVRLGMRYVLVLLVGITLVRTKYRT